MNTDKLRILLLRDEICLFLFWRRGLENPKLTLINLKNYLKFQLLFYLTEINKTLLKTLFNFFICILLYKLKIDVN